MAELGWMVAGILAVVCVWLLWVVEKAYSTGINVGRTEVLEEETARITQERLAKVERDAEGRIMRPTRWGGGRAGE